MSWFLVECPMIAEVAAFIDSCAGTNEEFIGEVPFYLKLFPAFIL
jgi:hypothetical protein